MNSPIFVVSDIHIGSGGSRDSFSQNKRNHCFESFLNYVEKENGELIILGDFIDVWRFSLKKIIKVRNDLFNRLSEMKVTYVPGNHDEALKAYCDTDEIPHPFFRKLKQPFVKIIGRKRFSFLHGHEFDWLYRNLTPRMGRFLGLSSSIIEYAKGYSVFTIEEALFNVEEKLYLSSINLLKQISGFTNFHSYLQNDYVSLRYKHIGKLLSKHENKKLEEGYDIAVSGHTHHACIFKDWYLNSGSWTGHSNNFIKILPDGKANIYNWKKNVPEINKSTINRFKVNSKFKTTYATAN